MLAALGLFVFDMATFPFSDLSRRSAWNHARSARVGARDASQYVGPGDDQVSISGMICPEAAGSYGAIDTLRAMADEGEAWPFVDGTGVVWGNYIITSLDERRASLLVDGVPRKIDFAIELIRVDDDARSVTTAQG